MYAGRYRRPSTVAARVSRVANPLEALKEGVLVAVNIAGYKKVPVVGKVKFVETDSITLEYWKGSWRNEWKPWLLKDGTVWTDTLPKGCILLVDFKLNSNNKLNNETCKYLKETYKNIREKH